MIEGDRKWCPSCPAWLPFAAFQADASRSDGLAGICKACCKARRDPEAGRRHYRANSERLKKESAAHQLRWARANRDESRRRKRERYRALRRAVIAHLGSRCPCGVTDPRALQIDHENGGGTAELKATVRETFYRRILRGEHTSPVRILCATCNWRARLRSVNPRWAAWTHIRDRKLVVARLGGRCACGETDVDVLHVDHVNGGGSIERRGLARTAYYRALLTAPVETLQVLCPNCNWIKKHDSIAERAGPKLAP